MKQRFNLQKLCITAAALSMSVTLAGCASPQAKTTKTETPTKTAETVSAETFTTETFTTEGKPTKTIETPWGPREIYDPAQDVAVMSSIEEIYESGAIAFGEVSRSYGYLETKESSNPAVERIRLARLAHYYDMIDSVANGLQLYHAKVMVRLI